MAESLIIGQSKTLTCYGINDAGDFVPPATTPVWTTSDDTKVTLTVSPDGIECLVTGIAAGAGVTVTATVTGPLTAVTTFDVVTNDPTSIAVTITQPPGDVDQRQKSANGRYLGLGFSTTQQG